MFGGVGLPCARVVVERVGVDRVGVGVGVGEHRDPQDQRGREFAGA